MPNYDRVALESFVAELHRVWTMAGPPSYADLEILSARVKGPTQETGPRMQVLPKSTTQEILTGRRHQPPRWQWVSRFWAVLRVAAAEAGVDPDSLGTLAEWKQKHEAVCAALVPAQMARVAGDSQVRIPDCATGHQCDRVSVPWHTTGLVVDEADVLRDEGFARVLRTAGWGWWCDYRDVVSGWQTAYLSLEPEASLIRAYDTELVPALLQTEEYADAAIRIAACDLPPVMITRLLELLMRRQQLLGRSKDRHMWAVIDESALRR